MADAVTITNVAMDDSEKSYTFPSSFREVTFRAITADISVYTTSGSDTVIWTLDKTLGNELKLSGRSLEGTTLYFTAASGTLQICAVTGIGS